VSFPETTMPPEGGIAGRSGRLKRFSSAAAPTPR
jgi:hypothetical protein